MSHIASCCKLYIYLVVGVCGNLPIEPISCSGCAQATQRVLQFGSSEPEDQAGCFSPFGRPGRACFGWWNVWRVCLLLLGNYYWGGQAVLNLPVRVRFVLQLQCRCPVAFSKALLKAPPVDLTNLVGRFGRVVKNPRCNPLWEGDGRGSMCSSDTWPMQIATRQQSPPKWTMFSRTHKTSTVRNITILLYDVNLDRYENI